MKRQKKVSQWRQARAYGYQEVTTKRLYFLFSIIIFLFLGLIARLAYMQLLNHDFYDQKLAKASRVSVTASGVRGEIYDASGRPLVENQTYQAVAFTRSNQMTAADIKALAQELLTLVSVADPKVTERDKIDYYLADPEIYRETVDALPTEEKRDGSGNRLSEGTIYANAVASVDSEHLSHLDQEIDAIALFSQMNRAANFETVYLKTEELSPKQVAQLVSQEEKYQGLTVKTAWKRNVLPTSLASIIGSVSSEEAGLPLEDADSYLAKGYTLKDRVGTSYLEKQYESYLQGTREVREIALDKNGNQESVEVVSESEKGKNVKLTVDLAFQDGVNQILQTYFKDELEKGNATYSEGVYAVVLDAHSGAVLALSGYSHEAGSDKLVENALGTVTDVFVPGSIVKGATLSTAWEHGYLSGNQVLTDQPIAFSGSTSITSWFTQYGNRDIDAIQALEYSSNTYMVQLALKMLGQDYQPQMVVSSNQLEPAMTTLRAGFAEYGLGAATGIDLPLESTGFIPKDYTVGNFLTNAFGQFDNYTPLQMAQYAATVANGGTRIAPRLVQGIYDTNDEGGLGEQVEQIEQPVLNQVVISPENMALLQEGFYRVVNSGSSLATGTPISQGATVAISAKTGTAETFATDDSGKQIPTVNTNIVAYAPSANPQIAVAVVLPQIADQYSKASHYMTRDIINLYHHLYPMN